MPIKFLDKLFEAKLGTFVAGNVYDIQPVEPTPPAKVFNGTRADDVYTGTELAEQINGNAGNDVLRGGAGNDTIDGGQGMNQLYGDDGNDEIYGGPDGNLLDGGNGDDIVAGAGGIDKINGGWGDDILYGNAGNDKINGGFGNDVIHGGAGMDVLSGGAGADMFVFDTELGGGNIDAIGDFNQVIAQGDKIALDTDVFQALSGRAGNALKASEFLAGTTAQTAATHILYDAKSGVLSYDADGAGGKAAVQFAQLKAGTILQHSDLILI
ncbi:calcium-binding protein [Microvirga pudoricolor]|uniref:calcium-binding protein n=1 Tax=Microvirga pudoricolor TaxID=2778729 RepID=UPI00194EA713|nr:calcium-binding protein [Microvirga pudoricolor]MBM6596575.1 hypothetical protein [Microvirga pudoricolor]